MPGKPSIPPRSEKDEARPDIAPMIDVTFLLLVFFMCSIQFKTLDGRLESYLPRDLGAQPTTVPVLPPEPVRISLRIHGDSTVISTGARVLDRIPRYRPRAVGARMKPVPLPLLSRRLEEIRLLLPDPKFVIDPDPRVTTRAVVAVLDACLLAGFKNLTFAIPPATK